MLNYGTNVGRYTVVGRLADGELSVTWEVEADGVAYALQVVRTPDTQQPGDFGDRMQRAAVALQAFRHPHVLGVVEVLQVDGAPAIVTELVPGGRTLEQWIAAGPHDGAEIGALFRQIVEGVGAAHRAGLLHRNLKPTKILLERDAAGLPVARISDFLLAKVRRETPSGGPAFTQMRTTFGTPQYMSPEQFRGAASVDERADLFSLGCVLYEMATGARAFEGSSVNDIYTAVNRCAYRPIAAVRPDLPSWVSELVAALLVAEPSARLADTDAVLARIPSAAAASADPVAPSEEAGEPDAVHPPEEEEVVEVLRVAAAPEEAAPDPEQGSELLWATPQPSAVAEVLWAETLPGPDDEAEPEPSAPEVAEDPVDPVLGPLVEFDLLGDPVTEPVPFASPTLEPAPEHVSFPPPAPEPEPEPEPEPVPEFRVYADLLVADDVLSLEVAPESELPAVDATAEPLVGAPLAMELVFAVVPEPAVEPYGSDAVFDLVPEAEADEDPWSDAPPVPEPQSASAPEPQTDEDPWSAAPPVPEPESASDPEPNGSAAMFDLVPEAATDEEPWSAAPPVPEPESAREPEPEMDPVAPFAAPVMDEEPWSAAPSLPEPESEPEMDPVAPFTAPGMDDHPWSAEPEPASDPEPEMDEEAASVVPFAAAALATPEPERDEDPSGGARSSAPEAAEDAVPEPFVVPEVPPEPAPSELPPLPVAASPLPALSPPPLAAPSPAATPSRINRTPAYESIEDFDWADITGDLDFSDPGPEPDPVPPRPVGSVSAASPAAEEQRSIDLPPIAPIREGGFPFSVPLASPTPATPPRVADIPVPAAAYHFEDEPTELELPRIEEAPGEAVVEEEPTRPAVPSPLEPLRSAARPEAGTLPPLPAGAEDQDLGPFVPAPEEEVVVRGRLATPVPPPPVFVLPVDTITPSDATHVERRPIVSSESGAPASVGLTPPVIIGIGLLVGVVCGALVVLAAMNLLVFVVRHY